MLKTKIEHFYGSQENFGLELIKLHLDPEDLNELEAIENGWLIHENKWYQCRSVRIVLDKFKDPPVLPIGITEHYTKDCDIHIINIYKKYIKYKKFKDIQYPFHDFGRMSFLVLKDNNLPVAFTKFIHYKGGLESQFNAWNYHKPSLSLGKKCLALEVEYAIALGLKHLYIGEGYELGSVYKADIPGFQWWTGSEWSEDVDKYKWLCTRDSSIKDLKELTEIFDE